jgi:hypothetical protein
LKGIRSTKMKVDFGATKTEMKWQETLDDFWKRATPLWFDWLQWIVVLGAIRFFAVESHSRVLLLAYGFSHVAVLLYLQALFFSVEFSGLPFIKSRRARRLASLSLSGILTLAIWFFLSGIVSQLQGQIQ